MEISSSRSVARGLSQSSTATVRENCDGGQKSDWSQSGFARLKYEGRVNLQCLHCAGDLTHCGIPHLSASSKLASNTLVLQPFSFRTQPNIKKVLDVVEQSPQAQRSFLLWAPGSATVHSRMYLSDCG